MIKKIEQFSKLNSDMHKELNLDKDIYISPKIESKWKIDSLSGLSMVEFENNNKFDKCVIVNNEKEPVIIKKDIYTVVLAIDCVKVAFIFNNELEIK